MGPASVTEPDVNIENLNENVNLDYSRFSPIHLDVDYSMAN